jgi:hypothetical protein
MKTRFVSKSEGEKALAFIDGGTRDERKSEVGDTIVAASMFNCLSCQKNNQFLPSNISRKFSVTSHKARN